MTTLRGLGPRQRIADYDYVKRPDLRERIVRQYQVTGIDRFIGQLRQALTETGEQITPSLSLVLITVSYLVNMDWAAGPAL